MISKIQFFAQLVISLNLVLAGLRLGLKNRQVGEKWVSDDCSYLMQRSIYFFIFFADLFFCAISQYTYE
ncbi:hypothetical protein BSPWISOXPB_5130 [uncultured Gammaproteobacteria bacterium]|nr:hypothetical protein BSPWISOXPB_5130 [uncultured Gammaproteobacteria bacterium]